MRDASRRKPRTKCPVANRLPAGVRKTQTAHRLRWRSKSGVPACASRGGPAQATVFPHLIGQFAATAVAVTSCLIRCTRDDVPADVREAGDRPRSRADGRSRPRPRTGSDPATVRVDEVRAPWRARSGCPGSRTFFGTMCAARLLEVPLQAGDAADRDLRTSTSHCPLAGIDALAVSAQLHGRRRVEATNATPASTGAAIRLGHGTCLVSASRPLSDGGRQRARRRRTADEQPSQASAAASPRSHSVSYTAPARRLSPAGLDVLAAVRLLQRRLRRCEACERDAVRRAAHVVEPDPVAELDRRSARRRARRRCRA